MLTSICKKNTPQKSCLLTFLPQQRYIYPFSVFQTTSTLLVAHILNLAWLRCGLDRQKSCPLLEKKWLFSVLFSLKITADLQNKLSGRVHVMTDNLLWNPKNVRDWSCFPFCNPAQCEIFVYVRIVFSKSRSAHFSEISEHKILKNCIYI